MPKEKTTSLQQKQNPKNMFSSADLEHVTTDLDTHTLWTWGLRILFWGDKTMQPMTKLATLQLHHPIDPLK